jgi:hypothetical protein
MMDCQKNTSPRMSSVVTPVLMTLCSEAVTKASA